uniref:SPRY domain-containing SOCS box protein 3 n=2 Tax=Gadus morhua TaxID=8049 RepID=A0A8C4Z343_GADMO
MSLSFRAAMLLSRATSGSEPGREVDLEQDLHVRGTTEGPGDVSELEFLEDFSVSTSCSISCSSSSPEAVTGESFCQCELQAAPGHGTPLQGPAAECLCGEEDDGFSWVWEETSKSTEVSLSCGGRKASFHADYSCGTAATRGTEALAEGQHFWEIKMTSPVYGTDMMVGVGTSEVNLDKFKYSFCSMLGNDEDSWGLSYTGLLQHGGTKEMFSPRFGQGSIIGVHLDTWHGTLTFYKNRHYIGVATTRLQNKAFYPMVCSTAAKSSVKVIRARHSPTSLQYLCCARLRKQMPRCPDVLRALDLPPGLLRLLQSQLGWVFNLPQGPEQPLRDAVVNDLTQDTMGPRSSGSPVSTQSASPSPSPLSDTQPCRACPQGYLDTGGTCVCPPTPPSSDSSEPEDYQSKQGCRT